MPQVPTKRDLGQAKVNGRANPADINPQVALDIGRAGAAYKHAFDSIGAAFAGLGEKQQAMDDANWLADAKISSLTADDQIRRDTELNAGADGTGFEQAPLRLDQSVKEIEAKPGGSQEARSKFKLWSAEQHFQTGRWAADTAQKRMQDFTTNKLDKRLDELTNLTSNNPDKANEYFRAYEDEVNSRVGSAISAADGASRVEQARTNILKSATITKAIKNPADFGRAVRAIEGQSAEFETANPETRAHPAVTKPMGGKEAASVSFELETGNKDPLKGVRNISKDAGGTKSYGNFGINSGGSAQQFSAKYGAKFGLTEKPGTPAFDTQWKNAAGADPVGLHDAEMQWWDETIGVKVTNNLTRAGIPSDMASDPRVVAYFADRSVQQGSGSIANHSPRIAEAYKGSNGSVETFLSRMGKADRAHVGSDFKTAMGDGTYSERGNETRVSGRERLSLAVGRGGTSEVVAPARTQGERSRFDVSKIPPIDGSTIQPQELLSLSPKDYHAVVTQMRPYLVDETNKRMEGAMSSLAAKGSQSLITPKEIDDITPIIGAKQATAWKDALRDGEEMFHISDAVKNMSPAQRQAQLSALVPTGKVENLSEAETRRFEMWSKAISHTREQINKDPLRYFTTENESGKQAAKLIAAATPDKAGTSDREQAYDTLIRLQKQEGIPPGKIRVLGEETAQSLATALKDAKSGQAALQIIEGARATYGRHFDRVWGELVQAGAPETYQAMTTATRAGQNALIDTFATEKAIGDSATKAEGKRDQMIARAGVKTAELNKAVSGEITDFTKALEGGNGSPRLIEAYRDATERLTLKYMTEGESSVTTAARRAANELFKTNTQVYRGVIVPADVFAQKGSKLTNGLDDNNRSLIDKTSEFIIEPSRSSDRYNRNFSHDSYVDSLKQNSRFVTDEEMRGVHLIDQFGNYVMVDTEKGRAPLFFTWDEISSSEHDTMITRMKRNPFRF